jgi:lipopolysaccharide cholinephosphotransferase
MFENNFEFDSEQLRQRYNPEGSKLRHDQLELLQMLKRVDAICKENNIQWWLSSGTLLGAARHKGFIPWDDDIDIVMLRKDYRRLEKILLKMEDKEFILHSMRSDVEYVNCFAKYRKRQGEVISKNRRYNYYKWRGIGFDIFTIEKTSYFAAKAASTIYGNLQHLTSYIRWGVIRKPLIRLIQVLCLGIIFPILRLIGLINPRGEYHYSLGQGWAKHTFFMKNTMPLKTAEFEGEQMPVPHDMDAYLTLVYGNWRAIPGDEAIKRCIHNQEYIAQIYGTTK